MIFSMLAPAEANEIECNERSMNSNRIWRLCNKKKSLFNTFSNTFEICKNAEHKEKRKNEEAKNLYIKCKKNLQRYLQQKKRIQG